MVDLATHSKATSTQSARAVDQPGSVGSCRPVSQGARARCGGPPWWLCEVVCLVAEGRGAEGSAPFVARSRQAVFMLWSP